MLERAAEFAAVRRALAAAAGGTGRLIVIEGEAGIGKSTILEKALAAAPELGLRPLLARGNELVRGYPYGVVAELFGRPVRDPQVDLEGLLNGPAVQTAGLLGIEGTGPSSAGDPYAVLHGLYWLTLNLAEQAPLVLAVDDAQWADEASLRFLHYLGQRVAELPVAVVAAFRTGEGVADSEVGRLLRGHRDAIHLEPSPLTKAAVGDMLAALLGRPPAPQLVDVCWSATRGNPYFVTELAWELRRSGVDGDGDEADGEEANADLSGLVPERVGRFVADRIGRLTPEARRLAEAVAILGEAATIPRAAALAGLEAGAEEAVVSRLVDAAILAPAGELAFLHPIVQNAVYEGIPPITRARRHREAALLLAAAGAPAGVVGAQLLEAERTGDPHVVELLMAAARVATGRGEPGVAARLLRRAIEEPPAGDQRLPVTVDLARADTAAGLPQSIERFEEALQLTTDPSDRARLLLELGHAHHERADHATAARTFKRGLAELADRSDPTAALLEAGYVASGWMAMDERVAAGQIGDRILSEPTFGRAHRELALSLAFQRSISGAAPRADLLEVVRRALAEAPIEELITEGQAVELATGVLFATDELPLMTDVLTRAIDASQRAGNFAKIGLYSVARSFPNLMLGRLGDAVADAESGFRASEIGWEAFLPQAIAHRALAQIERAELEAAGAILGVDDEPLRQRADWIAIPIVRARLFEALGDTSRAIAELRTAAQFGAAVGYRSPGPPEWRRWLSLALARAGERDEARSVAEDALQLGRESGARWPLAAGLHAAGVAEGGAAGIEMLREAAELLADSPVVLERTRILVELGGALRRQGLRTDARQTLGAALDLAHRIGARALLEGARSELWALGARPRRFALSGVESLTPAEERVAGLAAGGRTNREIAQALFVTPKAVEYHLANAYRKLGIASRTELSGALGTPAATTQ